MQRLRFILSATFLVALVASGCDNASPDTTPTDNSNVSATEDAAVSIANAISLDGGGALDVVAAAAEVASDVSNAHGSSGCIRERTYDETTFTWTGYIECERGRPDGLFYALFSRTGTFQFLDGDTPVQYPADADALNFDIIDGEGLRIMPGFYHELLDIGADLHIADIHTELLTVNGTYDRSATDTLYTRNAERTLVYELDLVLTDLQAPPGDRHLWRTAVSGMIEGTYHAIVTFTRGDAYHEREVTKTFTIVFGDGDGDVRDAIITIDGQTFHANVDTGQVEGIE